MIGIYKITNNINGKFYIGQSQNVEARLKQHFFDNCINKNIKRPLYAAIKKYGKVNFSKEIMAGCEKWELDILEELLIRKLKPQYNIKPGGNSCRGYHLSEEHKANISKAKKGNPINKELGRKVGLSNRGRKYSEERRKSLMGKTPWNKGLRTGKVALNAKPVLCIETNEKFTSLHEAGLKFGIRKSVISRVCNGDRKTTHGLHFKFIKKEGALSL